MDLSLIERLLATAQNDEMIDQYYTDTGKLLNEAAAEIQRLKCLIDCDEHGEDKSPSCSICVHEDEQNTRMERRMADAKLGKLTTILKDTAYTGQVVIDACSQGKTPDPDDIEAWEKAYIIAKGCDETERCWNTGRVTKYATIKERCCGCVDCGE